MPGMLPSKPQATFMKKSGLPGPPARNTGPKPDYHRLRAAGSNAKPASKDPPRPLLWKQLTPLQTKEKEKHKGVQPRPRQMQGQTRRQLPWFHQEPHKSPWG